MKLHRRLYLIGVALVSTALALAGCSDDGGGGGGSTTGGSVTITAPRLVRPGNESQVTGQITLVVTNVTVSGGSGTPTYQFQIASDSSFSTIVAQVSGIPQGGGGETSWSPGANVGSGQLFWRARASLGGTQGPFSAVGNFQFQGGPATLGRTDQVLLFDPLMGSSVGDVFGGEFTDEGWLVIASSNSIVYDMPTIETGFLEFDIKGLDIRNPTRDARHLFFMWDPSLGSDMTTNRFRVSLQKLDGRSSINDRWLRLRFITQGRQIDESSTFRGWTPERTYRVRIEWGQEGDVNACRVFIDADQKIFFQYRRPYIPEIHRIELGAAGRAETPEGAIYSNITIGTR
jgi:hypothetical protein